MEHSFASGTDMGQNQLLYKTADIKTDNANVFTVNTKCVNAPLVDTITTCSEMSNNIPVCL